MTICQSCGLIFSSCACIAGDSFGSPAVDAVQDNSYIRSHMFWCDAGAVDLALPDFTNHGQAYPVLQARGRRMPAILQACFT